MALSIRQHKIAALKAARKVIIEPTGLHGHYGLCNALSAYSATECTNYRINAVVSLKNYIMQSMGHQSFLQNWLIKKKHSKHWIEHRDPRMVATRVAWIDWMIKCLEEDEANGLT